MAAVSRADGPPPGAICLADHDGRLGGEDSCVAGSGMVMEGTQFCIGLANKPGVLGTLCATLRQAGVNVDALYISGDEDCCWVNVVASPIREATEALAKAGHNFFTERVLVTKVADRPGELERVSQRLADAGININYVYGSCTDGACTLVMNVDELERAAKILK